MIICVQLVSLPFWLTVRLYTVIIATGIYLLGELNEPKIF